MQKQSKRFGAKNGSHFFALSAGNKFFKMKTGAHLRGWGPGDV